jgi:hypothetical protein
MPRTLAWAGVAVGLIATVSVAAQTENRPADLVTTLERVGERVERYFARAQSIVCLETVNWQPLGLSLGAEGFGRHVESELRLSWDPPTDPSAPQEATALRQVLKVNGHPPRKNDQDNCTTPEQNATETQPLSMLLPGQRNDYTFAFAGRAQVDARAALMLDYREKAAPTVSVELVEGNDNCVSFDIKGGTRGRIWVDAETYDVLRTDQSLNGLVDIRMPRKVTRNGGSEAWTMERMDSSIRFKPVSFADPDETLILPVSVSSLRITRGSGTPRLRTTTQYTRYKRFLTGARVVGD